MFRKFFLGFVGAAVFGAVGVAAQTAPVTGRVVALADGKPVEGALVEIYRVDAKTKLPSDNTNKKGEFSFAGLPLGQTYVLSISAPGRKPGYFPGVKAGTEKILIKLDEGDGRRWSEDDIRQALAGGASQTAEPQLTPEQKKAMEERAKLEKEHAEKVAAGEAKFAVVAQALKDGLAAYSAKNWDLAITKFDEGIKADPEFVGSAPILYANRGSAYFKRGGDAYNNATKAKDASAIEKAKQDLANSFDSYAAAWRIVKTANPADIPDQNNYNTAKYNALSGLADIYRVVLQTKAKNLTAEETAAANEAIETYLALETDPAKKLKAQITLGDTLLREDPEAALKVYRAILVSSPDNPDALAGAGLSLVSLGALSEMNGDAAMSKTQNQEAIDLLTKFMKVAPPTHKLRAGMEDNIEELKNKVSPQQKPAAKKKS
jgi:tetratricopeptide (TPR) repeat protein